MFPVTLKCHRCEKIFNSSASSVNSVKSSAFTRRLKKCNDCYSEYKAMGKIQCRKTSKRTNKAIILVDLQSNVIEFNEKLN